MILKLDKVKTLGHFDVLANLFRYPRENYLEGVVACKKMLEASYPEASVDFSLFYEIIKHKTNVEIEELFNKTFHIQAICYLDLGYVLFAEDYKRGAFLVNMKNEQRLANNDCGEELADNLPNVLSLLPLIKDQDFVNELAVRIIMPALEKMLQEFDASRMNLKEKVRKKKQKVIIQEDMKHKNIYQYAIQATLNVFKSYFEGISYGEDQVMPDLGGFLSGCGTCCD